MGLDYDKHGAASVSMNRNIGFGFMVGRYGGSEWQAS